MEVNNSGFWDVAYRDNAPALLGVLRRYVKDMSVAQDLLHETFITAIDKYDGYTGKGSFEGWLYRIAVNTALMYLRNESNRQVPTEAVLSVMDDDDEDWQPLSDQVERLRLRFLLKPQEGLAAQLSDVPYAGARPAVNGFQQVAAIVVDFAILDIEAARRLGPGAPADALLRTYQRTFFLSSP